MLPSAKEGCEAGVVEVGCCVLGKHTLLNSKICGSSAGENLIFTCT